MLKQLPNFLTLLNLFSGCIAAVSIFQEQYKIGLMAIGGSVVFDYFDGWLARLVGVSNPLGKELDSLADVVSFGFVPGVIYYHLMKDISITSAGPWFNMIPLVGFIFTLFAAIRLARFNLDTSQTHDFSGLPTPAASMFPAGLLWIQISDGCTYCDRILVNPYLIIISLIVLCGLMISDYRLFNLKFVGFKWKGNEIKWSYLLLCFLLLWVMKEGALATAIVLYIFLSLFYKSFPDH